MPINEGYMDVWKELETNWDEKGFENLEKLEKDAIALFWLESEIMNGGLHQYFNNSSGDLAKIALNALKNIDAKISYKALKNAMEKLEVNGVYPSDRDERFGALNRLGDDEDPFEKETDILQELPEQFLKMLLDQLKNEY